MNLRKIALVGAASLGLLASMIAAESAVAQAVPSAQGITAGRALNRQDLGAMKQATANSTFATTSFADLAGTPITFTPVKDPTMTDAGATGVNSPAPTLVVDWSLDASKATATNGVCGVFANGALIAASTRNLTTGAGEGTLAGHYEVALTAGGSQVVKLQCKSGDTNVFTILQGQMKAVVLY